MRVFAKSIVALAVVLMSGQGCGGDDSSGNNPPPHMGNPPPGDGGITGSDGATPPPGDGATPPPSDGATPPPPGDGGKTCSTAVDGSGIFTAPNVWTKDVSCEPVDPSSKTMMAALVAAGGWGTGATQFQIDMSLVVLHATSSAPMVPFVQGPGYATPDCDTPSAVPMPAGGAIEGQSGYTCDAANDDCHLLVLYPPTHTLYEVYQATMNGSNLQGGCAVLWDLTKTYPNNMRGDQCTSADAAGFAMAGMLPDADEVATGTVTHAIRFALPNPSMAKGVYVHPASHAGAPSGSASLPPYGVRLRLRANYPVASLASPGARVLAKALQRFGMFLSDGGNVPLMVQSDQFTTHKWADAAINLDSHSLFGITPSDFEVVDLPATTKLTYACVRNP